MFIKFLLSGKNWILKFEILRTLVFSENTLQCSLNCTYDFVFVKGLRLGLGLSSSADLLRSCLCAYVLTCVACLLAHVPACLPCLRAYVPTCLACLRVHVPTCLACLHAHVPTCLACLRVHVATSLVFLRAHVATGFACLRGHMPTCLACLRPHGRTCFEYLRASRVNMPCVLMYSRVNVVFELTCLCADLPWVSCLTRLAWSRDHLSTYFASSVSTYNVTFFQFHYHCCWSCTHYNCNFLTL